MSKRKREAIDDDGEPLLGRQILPVANLPEDFNDIPADGMEYLFTVRRDARHLPHVTRAVNPYERPDSPSSLNHDTPMKPKHPALPSDEWRALFIKRFKNCRKNITQPTIHVDFSTQTGGAKFIPDRERDHWWAFIAGRPEAEWNPPRGPIQRTNARSHLGYGRGLRGFSNDAPGTETPQETWHINDEGEVELALRVDPSESLPTPLGSPIPSICADGGVPSFHASQPSSSGQQGTETYKYREPTLTLLKHINYRMTMRLLMYLTHWMNVHVQRADVPSVHFTDTHARWIFALLLRVEDTISADDMSLLRSLARAALTLLKELIQRRSLLDITDTTNVSLQETSCWLVFSAVAGVWGQWDLWMDAEAMLASLE